MRGTCLSNKLIKLPSPHLVTRAGQGLRVPRREITPQVWQGNGCKSSERQQKLKSAFLGQRFYLLCRCPTFCPMSPLFQARAMVLATGQEVMHVPRGSPAPRGPRPAPRKGKQNGRRSVARPLSQEAGSDLQVVSPSLCHLCDWAVTHPYQPPHPRLSRGFPAMPGGSVLWIR